MKQSTQVYLVIFLIIALLAFILSSAFASVAVIDNTNSTKLTTIENDGFEPHDIKSVEVIIPKPQNTTHNNTTSSIQNFTDDLLDLADEKWNDLW